MGNEAGIIITGGLGFIGSHYVRAAVERGERTLVLDALTYAGRLENIKDLWPPENERALYCANFGSLPRRAAIDARLNKNGVSYNLFSEERKDLEHKIPQGFALRSLSNPQALKKEIERMLGSQSRLFLLLADAANSEAVETILPYFSRIVHFAAETHVDRSILSAEPFLFSDVHGTHAILDAMRKTAWNGRLLHVSTDEVYGEACDRPFAENAPFLPRNPYSAAKAAADSMVSAFVQTYGIDAVIVRPSNNYGPYQYPEKLMPLMIIKAMLKQPLPVYGDGMQQRDWLYVKDCIRGVQAALERGRKGEAYNLGGGGPQPNIKIVKEILNFLNASEDLIAYVKDRPGHDRKYWLDSSKAEAELVWKPEARFDEALKDTVEWYAANRDWWRPILENDPEYREFLNRTM